MEKATTKMEIFGLNAQSIHFFEKFRGIFLVFRDQSWTAPAPLRFHLLRLNPLLSP